MKKSSLHAKRKNLRVALVVPHIFMHKDILPEVIFSPGHLALSLANHLGDYGVEVTLFSPGPVETTARNLTADLGLFERELKVRGDRYIDLLRKHPFTFITLARQVQSELLALAYSMANNDQFDVVHIYTNEEELALPFAALCQKPVVFTHHDPFSFLIKYKNNFPKFKQLNWISLSYAQREGMPKDTNWVANIYHGVENNALQPVAAPARNYVAYLGRIIETKGVHLAIAAVKKYNESAEQPLTLKIAGKHDSEKSKDSYWHHKIEPELSGHIEYVGFLADDTDKSHFLANASALLVPSLFDEPFGMVTIEAFACGTPVIALDSGALPEVIKNGVTGIVIPKTLSKGDDIDENAVVNRLVGALKNVSLINPSLCRHAYETDFTVATMVGKHREVYTKLTQDRS